MIEKNRSAHNDRQWKFLTKKTEPTRSTHDLDGRWEFVTDPENTGVDEKWSEPEATWPDRARIVSVPGAWEEDDADREYTGKAWYRRTFDGDLLSLDGRVAILRFGAVDYEAMVWVNGQRVGTNRGGYLPFTVDVTEALTDGQNTIVVAVSDPDDLSELPHGKQGDPWYTRVSGIWQSVRLELKPRTHVQMAEVTPDLDTNTAIVDLDVEMGPASPNMIEAVVRASVNGNTVSETVRLDEQTTVSLEFDDPAYWSPADPTLYDLEVTLHREDIVVDRYEDYFGMRSFETRDGQFYLNGEPITIRGILDQGYYPKTLYRPPDEETIAATIDRASELGFNLIRKHLKPPHPAFLEYADRKGMLVWAEPAAPEQYTERSREELRAQIEGMVERDYNRPSVVLWSLYNDGWGIGHHAAEESLRTDTEKQQFLANCYRDLRDHDPTRVVCDNSGGDHVTTDVNDFHRHFVCPDRVNEWTADLDHICAYSEDNYATKEFDEPDAPIVISEFGTWGFPDVDDLREASHGDPNWFHHDFLTDPLKSPANVDERFDSTLSTTFEDYADLAAAWQSREFVSLKRLIESMRTREKVAGYVLTGLSDIEWECNGILNYQQGPKSFVTEFAGVNGELTVVATPDHHAVWAGEPLDIELSVVNDGKNAVSGTLEWEVTGEGGRESITVPGHGVQSVEVTVTPSAVGKAITTEESLSATVEMENRTIATSEPITIVDDDRREAPSATVFAGGEFASRLAEHGVDVTHTLSDGVDIAFTDEITAQYEGFAAEGGAVVHVPGSNGTMHASGPLTYRSVSESESWSATASFLYQDSPLFDDLCSTRRLGWEFEGMYPYSVATDLDPSVDQIHVGYVEGWLANWGSPLVVRGRGQGTIATSTFRGHDRYGRHPTVTLLYDRLIRLLTGEIDYPDD